MLQQTAKVVNTSKRVVIDGGGLVTLSGGGERRILYQNTCDPKQTWTTDHCDDQATPRLVLQHLTLADGNSTGETYDGGGGGAIFVRGGRLKIVDATFVDNRCDRTGPDLGGAAVRALSQHHGRPVYVVGSTFTGGRCSNGSALSSIGVSWSVYNSTFTDNRAIGRGANPARPGTPGGGSGGAIYADGNDFTVLVAGSTMTGNHAREGGRRDLLRQQRPHRRPADPVLQAQGQPQRRLREQPRHLLPRRSRACGRSPSIAGGRSTSWAARSRAAAAATGRS